MSVTKSFGPCVVLHGVRPGVDEKRDQGCDSGERGGPLRKDVSLRPAQLYTSPDDDDRRKSYPLPTPLRLRVRSLPQEVTKRLKRSPTKDTTEEI